MKDWKNDHDAICYLHSDAWTEELAMKFVLSEITVNLSWSLKFEQCRRGAGIIYRKCD